MGEEMEKGIRGEIEEGGVLSPLEIRAICVKERGLWAIAASSKPLCSLRLASLVIETFNSGRVERLGQLPFIASSFLLF